MRNDIRDKRILITGSSGFVGLHLYNKLLSKGCKNIKVIKRYSLAGTNYNDLRDTPTVKEIFSSCKPDIVFHLAAKVGGLIANDKYKEEFYYDNTLINTNVVHEAYVNNVERFIAIGTGCSYSEDDCNNNVLTEDKILDGIPRWEHAPYAYSKRNMLIHLKAITETNDMTYAFCVPANIYGQHDDFDLESSHVMASLIRRIVTAKDSDKEYVGIIGSVKAERDFIYIKDFIDALYDICTLSNTNDVFNIATGKLTSINEVINIICEYVNFNGKINLLNEIQEGQNKRIFSVEKLNNLGWVEKYNIKYGISRTIDWYRDWCKRKMQI